MLTFIKALWTKWFRRNRPFTLTKGGWVFILYTIGVGAGAINTGNNLLYLIFGLFLGIIIASGVLSDMSLWSVSAELSFPISGRAQVANFLALKMSNRKKWFPSLSLVVEVEGEIEGEPLRVKKFIPVLYPQESIQAHLIVTPFRRGWFAVKKIKLATRFPFGLLYKWWMQDLSHSLASKNKGMVVYPEKIGLSLQSLSLAVAGEEQVTSTDRSGEGTTVFGIREFNESDNPRRIHWKASAKRMNNAQRANWLVRELEADQKKQAFLIWPGVSVISSLKPAEIENFIRFTVSLIETHIEDGQNPQFLIPKEGDPPIGFWTPGESEWGDSVATLLAYLSLFDIKKPNHARTQKLLKDANQTLEKLGPVERINLLETFMAWQKDKEHAA